MTAPRRWDSQPRSGTRWISRTSSFWGGARERGKRAASGARVFAVEVGQNLLDYHWVLDAGDDSHRRATGPAGLDVDAEYALQALRPRHRGAAFARRGLRRIPCRAMLASPAPFRRCYSRPVPAVGGEYAVEACQVDSGLGHQGRQPGDEIERFEDDVRGAVTVGGLQLVAHVPAWGERQALLRDRRGD